MPLAELRGLWSSSRMTARQRTLTPLSVLLQPMSEFVPRSSHEWEHVTMSDRFEEQQVSPLPPTSDADHVSSDPTASGPPPGKGATLPPESPVALILMGLFFALVLGGFSILSGEASDLGLLVWLGYALLVAGSVITLVGVVAAGVRLGMQWAKYDNEV
jgi:hypothetical protein